ncbi:MAG: radical SAM family heme chaperone HemW [Gemmatimonadetes bacterium]|nr:radical SAM family heme chaperone HemW [Gemmatimonadota bacterium]MDA1104250.1 radical SAM family heme chaperone HemW [Gemmatimonadota bacterium]
MSSAAGEATRVGAVYVHAPFCARRCVYCDFAVTVRREGDLPAWIESLGAELRLVEAEGLFRLAPRLDSLYVGGGTPSLLGPGAMRGLAELLGRDRLQDPDLEWTAEANPESFTDSVARAWAEAGVNRISLGLQTFHAAGLKWMGRLHGVEGPARALEAARRAGINNVSVDLIFGLPSALGRSWEDDLERVLALDVPHVSLYGLTIEGGTALGRAVREGRESPVDDEQYREEFLRAAEVFTNAGYVHYEVSNFARPGAEARHNGRYWDGSPYLGLGNGAHSYCEPIRRWNVRDWEDYRTRLRQGKSPEGEREVVGADAAALERAWLALRTREGIVMPEATSLTGKIGLSWRDQGLAVFDQGRLRLTAEGWLVLDRLALEWDDAMSSIDLGKRVRD